MGGEISRCLAAQPLGEGHCHGRRAAGRLVCWAGSARPQWHLRILCWGACRGAGRGRATSLWREVRGRPPLRLEAGLQVLETSRAPGLLLFLGVLRSPFEPSHPSGPSGGDRAGPTDFGGPQRISVVHRGGDQISSSCLQSSLPRGHRVGPGGIPGGEVRAGRWVGRLKDKDRRAAWQWNQTARRLGWGARRRVGGTADSGRGRVWDTALWSPGCCGRKLIWVSSIFSKKHK